MTSIPTTQMLKYLQGPPFTGRQGPPAVWGPKYLKATTTLLENPEWLLAAFDASVTEFAQAYRNYQPFRPVEKHFGVWRDTKIPHGQSLRGTTDVAHRLAEKPRWDVEGGPGLSFRYLDREIVIAHAKPRPNPSNPTRASLRVDLILGNEKTRAPILCEVKVKNDKNAFYALIQLLTQASYAVSSSQRERLVLYASQRDFILKQALPGQPATIDLYVMLVEQPTDEWRRKILKKSIALSRKLTKDERVRSRIGKIAWIEGQDHESQGLTLRALPRESGL
jgi:hypothetical protein